MTLFFRLSPPLLSAIGAALVCALPVAYAAELEGTPVEVDSAVPVQIQTPEPAAAVDPNVVAPEQAPPLPSPDEHERMMKDNERWVRDNQQQVRDHQNWEQNWEKNLSEAFDGEGEGDSLNLALLIPILAILFIFGGPVILLILILVFFFGARRRRQQDINMNIDKLLAAGRDIPIELLRGDEPRAAVEIGSRDKGIRNIFLGAGWLVFLTVLVGFHIGAAGLIWIALGVSQVLIWHLNTNVMPAKTGDSQAGQQD